MNGMNERPNDYRKVPFAEHEANHLFKVLRHFPELAKTMPEVHEMQVKMGRNWEDQKKPGKEKPREVSFRSTRKLDDLKKTAHGVAGGQMNEMRKVLLCSRNPAMARRFQEQDASSTRYLENGSLSTAPSAPNTPGNAHTRHDAAGIRSPTGKGTVVGNGSVGLLEDAARRGPEARPTSVGTGSGPAHARAPVAALGASSGASEGGAMAMFSVGSEGAAAYDTATSGGGGGHPRLDKFGNDLSADPLTSANNKLAKASLSYAPSAQLNVLGGFQGQDLDPAEFDVQLRRCLQVNLSKRELSAMFQSMDADGSGFIDGVEFTRYFLTVGNIAREKIRLSMLDKQRREAHHSKMHALEEEQRAKLWEKSQVSQESNEVDEERVFKRLAKVALHWDNGSAVSAAKLVGFDSMLTPFEFKMQLEASFGFTCDKEEMGALMKRYKTSEGEYCVDGKAFLFSFAKLRRDSREEHAKELRKLAARKDKVLKLGKYYSDTGYQVLGSENLTKTERFIESLSTIQLRH